MSLKEEIQEYIKKHKDPMKHEFADGSKVINQRLSHFLINWHNQAVHEYKNFGTKKNEAAIRKLISNN
jgi:hypothetical protein